MFFLVTALSLLATDVGVEPMAVELPIARVMVFSDRARVTRVGKIAWGSGQRTVRAPDLPGSVLAGSLRVTATGARVVRVEQRPVDRERWSIDQVDAFLADLEKQSDKIALASGRLGGARESMSFFDTLQAAAPVPEKDRLGKPPPPLAPDGWRAVQDWLARRRSSARSTESAAERELRELTREYLRLQREVQRRDLGAATDRKVELLIVVEPERGDGELTVEYAVPGALWRPAYELYFDPDHGKVDLLASALVSQATGEEWSRVRLSLSTAIPSLGIELPKLETWTLGDDREWTPRPTARNPPRRAGNFAPPAMRPPLAELERDADRALLGSRIQLLRTAASGPPPAKPRSSLWRRATSAASQPADEADRAGQDGDAEEDLRQQEYEREAAAVQSSMARPEAVPRQYAPAAPAPPPSSAQGLSLEAGEAIGFDADDAEATSAVTKSVGSARTSAYGGPASSARSLPLYARQGWAPQVFADPSLPAVTAGGFDWVYDAPLPADVPAQAEQLRVPLASRSYDVQTFYEATPALATTAFLKAAVKNGSKLPILAGPANVFVNRTFSGDAALATTGPGGTLELPLGADENIRLTHTVVPSTQTQGFLIGEEDVTDYAVKIEIGNYKKKAVTVRVIDQVPKTNEEKVKVALVTASPKAQREPDADGLLYWHVEVPAGGTKAVTFTYRITRPKGWRLAQ